MKIFNYTINTKLIVVILSLISTISAAIMVSGIKLLSADLNPFIIAFYRCLFGVIVILPFLGINKFKALRTNFIKLQLLRASINVYSMISWFIAIGTLQLETALTNFDPSLAIPDNSECFPTIKPLTS